MSYLTCSNPLIAYQLADGIFSCTEEMVHSKAVLERHTGTAPVMYIMWIKPLEGQLHCACNFRDPGLGGRSNLKIAGDLAAIREDMPSFVAKHKLRQVLFDEPDLYQKFLTPELARLMKVVDYVPDPPEAYNGLPARFEPNPPKVVSAPPSRPATGYVPPSTSPSSSRMSTKIWVWAFVLLALWLIAKNC